MEDSIVISGLVQRIYRKSLKKKNEYAVFGRVEKLGGQMIFFFFLR